MKNNSWGILLSGLGAGIVNGLFGAGGGMVLIPLLTLLTGFTGQQLFPISVAMILPMTLIAVAVTQLSVGLPVAEALPYLLGGTAGGIAAGQLGKRISPCLLHRILGGMILVGGIRYIC